MVVGYHCFELTPKMHCFGKELAHLRCMAPASALCVCVCVWVMLVFQRIKSHIEWLTLLLVTGCVWPPFLFPGAFRLAFRTQMHCPSCRGRSRLTFRSLSQPLSGLRLCRGEARSLPISCQGQARELQDPDCLSKRASFQSDWTGSAQTSESKWPSGRRWRASGLRWRQPASQRCVRWEQVCCLRHSPSVSFHEASRQRW